MFSLCEPDFGGSFADDPYDLDDVVVIFALFGFRGLCATRKPSLHRIGVGYVREEAAEVRPEV